MAATVIAPLTELVPPPLDSTMARDWGAVETALNTRLPADYKEIVNTYGDGAFFNIISLWVPTDDPYSITVAGRAKVDEVFAGMREQPFWDTDPDLARLPDGELRPVDLGDSRARPPYVSWGVGVDGEGEAGFWHCTGDDPNQWPILYGRMPDWDYHPGGLLEYLVGIITGSIASNRFNGKHDPTFTPFRD